MEERRNEEEEEEEWGGSNIRGPESWLFRYRIIFLLGFSSSWQCFGGKDIAQILKNGNELECNWPDYVTNKRLKETDRQTGRQRERQCERDVLHGTNSRYLAMFNTGRVWISVRADWNGRAVQGELTATRKHNTIKVKNGIREKKPGGRNRNKKSHCNNGANSVGLKRARRGGGGVLRRRRMKLMALRAINRCVCNMPNRTGGGGEGEEEASSIPSMSSSFSFFLSSLSSWFIYIPIYI